MSKLMKYKSFQGSVNYSLEDRCLYGRIEFIEPVLTYEGSTIDELEQAFREAVDDYIADCEAEGIAPEKAFSGTFNVRPGPELHRKVAIKARENNQNLNQFIVQTLERAVSEQQIINHNHHVHIHNHSLEVSRSFSTRLGPQGKEKWQSNLQYIVN